MRKSLKTSVQVFGVAGLVLLAGCGADTTVIEPVTDSVEVMEQGTEKVMEVLPEADDEDVDSGNDVMMKEDDVVEQEAEVEVEPVAGGDGNDSDGDQMVVNVSYTSPGGPETITVSLAVTDGAIASASALPGATHAVSTKWQSSFAESISEAVVGKSIDDIAGLDAIGGASLTTGGFKEAVAAL